MPESGPTGGSPSYGGYEYQISVTVWAGLDLLLVKDVTDALAIEPRSREDVQADLKVHPDAASVRLRGVGREYDLILQAKSCSTGPWSARDVAGILAPRPAKPGAPGPAPRESSLAMLAKNARLRYMFVTNEGLQSSLYPHRAQSLFDWPDTQTLPPYTSQYVTATQTASIAGRLAFCPGVTFELLDSRTRNILSFHGHVPLADQDCCIRDLKDAVRERLLGHGGGRWTKDELVSTLVRHHGSILPTRAMDHYVPPRPFEAIRRALLENHAVVIAGPPGTGKTLTADYLEEKLRRSPIPFCVIGEEGGPGYVRAQLTRPDPILFHLRDPWGGNQLMSGADRWTNELPKLLEHRSSNRKFLITSRSDVLHSAGEHLEQQLRTHIVTLEVEDYGPTRLAEIYERRCRDISEPLRRSAQAYQDRVLKALQRPFEVDRFFVALARENPISPHRVEQLIVDSQIEAISRVVTYQVLGRAGGIECAAFLWALLAARGSVAEERVPKLRRQVRQIDSSLQLEVENFVDFLIAGRNLRRDGAVLAFYHPRVEDGLRAAIEGQPGTTERVLSRLCDALGASYDDWGADSVLRIHRAAEVLKNVQLEPAPATRRRLDALLLSNALTAETRDIKRAFNELAKYGSVDSGPACLARALVGGLPEPGRINRVATWHRPAVSEAEWQILLRDSETAQLTRRFVCNVLTFTHNRYGDDVLPFLARLCPDLRDAYWSALQTITSDDFAAGWNIQTIVSGACACDIAELDAAVELLARPSEEADRHNQETLTQLRRVQELELDHWKGDFLVERFPDRFQRVGECLEAVVRIRCRMEGSGWIATHPHRSLLIPALAAVIRGHNGKPDSADLRILIQSAHHGQRALAWNVAAEYWDSSLEDLYAAELSRADLADATARQTLVRIARLRVPATDPDAWIRQLSQLTSSATPVRRLELIHDVAQTKFAGKPANPPSGSFAGLTSARRLAETYEGALRELALALMDVLQQRRCDEIVAKLSTQCRALLAALLPELTDSLAALFLSLATGVGIDPMPTVQRLLGSDNPEPGVAAVQQLVLLEHSTSRSALLDAALQHGRYAVRRAVLMYLAARAEAVDRTDVLGMVKDRSAGVRLAVAEQMKERHWPQAIDALVALLKDTRDFNTDTADGARLFESVYKVARVAARALGRYETLPEFALTALIERVNDLECDDPIVGCDALDSLSRQDDPRITPLLLAALRRRDLDGPYGRPLSQTAGWALLDRARAGRVSVQPAQYERLTRAACIEPDNVAAPVLLTLHHLDSTAALRMRAELQRIGKPQRAELLLVAAALGGQLDDEHSDPALQLLARLSDAQPPSLTDTEHQTLRNWRSTLDTEKDVADETARLVDRFLSQHGIAPLE